MRDFERDQKQDQQDIRSMAFANSQYLHNCTKTPHCEIPVDCVLCMSAARLSLQWLRPRIEERVVQSLMDTYNIRCNMPHYGSDD